MQADQITLAVDPLNNGTTVNETFTRFEEFQNRAVYIGEGHLPDARNTIGIYRTFPTKTGNFKGVCKTAVKSTLDVEVAGVDSNTTITAPIIMDLSFSVPVGVTTAELVKARQRLIALLDDDSFMNALNVQLMV